MFRRIGIRFAAILIGIAVGLALKSGGHTLNPTASSPTTSTAKMLSSFQA